MAHSKALPALPANAAGCGLVVDAGFSFTHAVPIFNWQVLARGVQRINLGGRALTNYMKARRGRGRERKRAACVATRRYTLHTLPGQPLYTFIANLV